MEVRPATHRDRDLWLEARRAIWPHVSKDAHERAITAAVAEDSDRCFLVLHEEGTRMGFVEGRIEPPRAGAPGGVGVIESWYILPNFRWDGIGQQLLAAAEVWFRERGCGELRAEGQVGKEASYKPHVAVAEGEPPPTLRFRRTPAGEAPSLPVEGEDG